MMNMKMTVKEYFNTMNFEEMIEAAKKDLISDMEMYDCDLEEAMKVLSSEHDYYDDDTLEELEEKQEEDGYICNIEYSLEALESAYYILKEEKKEENKMTRAEIRRAERELAKMTLKEFKDKFAPGTDEYDWTDMDFETAEMLDKVHQKYGLKFPLYFDIKTIYSDGEEFVFGSADSHLWNEKKQLVDIQVQDDGVVMMVTTFQDKTKEEINAELFAKYPEFKKLVEEVA